MVEATTSRGAVRIGRALASPIGVLITVPLLVAAVGLAILWLGREATRGATDEMARADPRDARDNPEDAHERDAR